MAWRARTLAVSVAATAVLLAGCGDDSGEGEGTAPEPAPGSTDAVDGGATIVAEDFALTSITVAAGAEVTFRNDDGVAHTATADDGTFDSGSVPSGGSTTFAAPGEPGEVAFHCEIHPSMTGTLTVEG